jgi:hypothetical protein
MESFIVVLCFTDFAENYWGPIGSSLSKKKNYKSPTVMIGVHIYIY